MEFLEGSRGIYRPIRVLFDTPIYDRALQLCWHIGSYKSQIALLMELLRLQQKKQIQSQVTAEDMINFLLVQSKSTLRERLWEFELEDFDEDDAKPLLMLVWAVNVSNKMRDIEFEAQMLLNSPEALPPNFQHPKVLSMAQDYAKILREKQQETPSSKLLCPREVVIEVVPRVLQGFWVLPPRPLLNMPSQLLSKMSVGVTKAVLDRLSSALTTVERQATFSRSVRDDMVLSILTKIRQMYPQDILKNWIKSFAPVLLSKIVDIAVEQICEMFQPQDPKVPAHLTPAVKSPATTSVQDDFNLAITEEQPAPSAETYSAVVSPPPATLTPPAEPLSTTKVQIRDDINEMPSLEKDPEPTREPDSAAVTVIPPPLTHPAEPMVITAVQDGLTKNLAGTEQTFNPVTNSAEMSPQPVLPTSPTELNCITNVQDREDTNERPSLEEDPKPTREPDSAVALASLAVLTPPHEPAVIVTAHSEVKMTEEKRALGFFRWLFQQLCCCFVDSDTETG